MELAVRLRREQLGVAFDGLCYQGVCALAVQVNFSKITYIKEYIALGCEVVRVFYYFLKLFFIIIFFI